jgi:hypothetical protein
MPSVVGVNEAPPPLMLGDPETPELASVANAEVVTGPDMNQPFIPSGGGMVRLRDGATLSTSIEAEAIVDVSPKVECTQ